MSLESANAFLDKLVADRDFRSKFAQIEGVNVIEKAKGEGFDFTKEEMKQAYNDHNKMLDLSDEQLEAIAGGNETTWVALSITAAAAGACI